MFVHSTVFGVVESMLCFLGFGVLKRRSCFSFDKSYPGPKPSGDWDVQNSQKQQF